MIEIKNCSKTFGEIHAIDHVSMEIGERQIFGLIGTNGAGKSTLLRMAAGVIKPDEGEILVGQEPVYENETIKQQIFCSCTDPHNDQKLFFHSLTVGTDPAFFIQMKLLHQFPVTVCQKPRIIFSVEIFHIRCRITLRKIPSI